MCLCVHHKQTKPIIADRDYLVHKLLLRNSITSSDVFSTHGSGVSPYREFRYIFGQLVTVRKVANKLPKKPKSLFLMPHRLSVGLHSMRERKCVGQWDYLKFRVGTKYSFCPAVIPKGAKLWYGDSGDVLSDKLIVFRDMAHLQEHYDGVSSVS